MTAAVDRPFGFWTATALVVGGMIGSGIFLLPASLAPLGWTGIVAFGVSIAGSLCIAWTLAQLAAASPQASGAIAVTGSVLGVLPGVLIGWAYWISVWAACAAIAIAATSYLSAFVPALTATPLSGALSAVAVLWLLTLLNLRGAKAAGRFQVATTLLKLLPLLLVAGIFAVNGSAGAVTPPEFPPASTLLVGLTAAVTLTMFPLVGFESAGVAAARVRDPARNVVRATMVGTALTGALYIAVTAAIGFSLPTAAVVASPAPFALFVETFLGRGAGLVVAAFAALAAIGALNGWVLIQGEVPLGMARAGLLPRWFAKVSERDVPVRVLLLASGLATLLILSNTSRSTVGLFTFLVLLTTSTTLYLYLAVCIAALIRRVAVPTALVGVPFTLWAMWGAGLEAAGLGLLLTLTALPLYWLRGRGTVAPAFPLPPR